MCRWYRRRERERMIWWLIFNEHDLFRRNWTRGSFNANQMWLTYLASNASDHRRPRIWIRSIFRTDIQSIGERREREGKSVYLILVLCLTVCSSFKYILSSVSLSSISWRLDVLYSHLFFAFLCPEFYLSRRRRRRRSHREESNI